MFVMQAASCCRLALRKISLRVVRASDVEKVRTAQIQVDVNTRAFDTAPIARQEVAETVELATSTLASTNKSGLP